jgi:hypothetical protein
MLKNLAMVLGLAAGLTACMGPYGSGGYGNTGYGYSARDSGYLYSLEQTLRVGLAHEKSGAERG